MTFKVFIDGRHGTTGLKIDERLAGRRDVEVLSIPEDKRKDPAVKAEYINAADVVFLCLPDAASRESVALLAADNTRTRFLDASTAHRTHPDWAYGLPELQGQRARIRASQRIAVPGCHATGFVLSVAPLVTAGLLPADYPFSCTSQTGYSGGGKEMIAEYEAQPDLPEHLRSARLYALGLAHKHLPEMKALCGLAHAPLFSPVVGPFAQGMLASVPLLTRLLPVGVTPEAVHAALASYYAGEACVKVMPPGGGDALEAGFLPATRCNGTNRAELFVFGHAGQILLVARLDNLGKGASGAAIQCMNIALGCDELDGLTV
ncbi:MAG: N-acetyl-gamma-glutamyl-phosphate reductase [Candidatus Dactylopiibacterium sp.]|nr:N-acetyl-gamma-glutamyl-phosphate reductase [Candidatus Dactylopiibacterium sp.]